MWGKQVERRRLRHRDGGEGDVLSPCPWGLNFSEFLELLAGPCGKFEWRRARKANVDCLRKCVSAPLYLSSYCSGVWDWCFVLVLEQRISEEKENPWSSTSPNLCWSKWPFWSLVIRSWTAHQWGSLVRWWTTCSVVSRGVIAAGAEKHCLEIQDQGCSCGTSWRVFVF